MPSLLETRTGALQANTTINSAATQRVEAFTDVDVNLSGAAASACAPGAPEGPPEGEPAAATPNGVHTPATPNGLASRKKVGVPVESLKGLNLHCLLASAALHLPVCCLLGLPRQAWSPPTALSKFCRSCRRRRCQTRR